MTVHVFIMGKCHRIDFEYQKQNPSTQKLLHVPSLYACLFMCVRLSHVISVSFPLSSFAMSRMRWFLQSNKRNYKAMTKTLAVAVTESGISQVTVCTCTLYTFKMHRKRTHESTQQQNRVTKLLILKAKSQNVEIA